MTPSPHPQASPADAPRRVSPEGEPIATVRINGGPEIPFDEAGKEALKKHISETFDAAKTGKSKRGGIAADQLRAIVDRIERLEEEKAGLASDIKYIYAEAKGNGFDCKTLRKIIALRRQDAAERDEADYLLDTYARALGMKPQLDLFEGEA